MKVVLVSRPTATWGGDLRALGYLREALTGRGHEVNMVERASDAPAADLVVLANSCLDQRPAHRVLRDRGQPYAVVPFHEDQLGYWGPARGFFEVARAVLAGAPLGALRIDIDRLWENPAIVRYFAGPMPMTAVQNYEPLRDAVVCVANSVDERRTLLRDCPGARVAVVPWDTELPPEPSDAGFRELLGLECGSYILQVGRLEVRKNQLATLLACADLGLPLVFVATATVDRAYEQAFLSAVRRFGREVTLVSQTLSEGRWGPLRVVAMPGGQKLPWGALRGLYEGAAVHVHPAFCETPGLTYLESVSLGVPTVVSSGSGVRDYLLDPALDELVCYAPPENLHSIQSATRALLQGGKPSLPAAPLLRRRRSQMGEEFERVLSSAIAEAADPKQNSEPPRGMRAAT